MRVETTRSNKPVPACGLESSRMYTSKTVPLTGLRKTKFLHYRSDISVTYNSYSALEKIPTNNFIRL